MKLNSKLAFTATKKLKNDGTTFVFHRAFREKDAGFLLSREKRLAFAVSPCSYFPTQTQEGKDVLLVLARTLVAPHRGAAPSTQPEEKRTEQQQWKNFNRVHVWFLPLVSPVPRGRVQPSTVDREPMAGISNDLVLEREHCRQVLAEHKDALSSVHEEIESWKEKHEEASGALREKHDMLTHASNLLEEKHLELEHKTTQLEVMKEALSEADVDGHKSGSGGGSSGEEEEEDDAISEEEPTEQPSGRSSRGKHSSKNRKRGGHNGSKKSVSSKPHGGEEHGEDDLDSDHEGTHEEADDTATEEEPAHEEVE